MLKHILHMFKSSSEIH